MKTKKPTKPAAGSAKPRPKKSIGRRGRGVARLAAKEELAEQKYRGKSRPDSREKSPAKSRPGGPTDAKNDHSDGTEREVSGKHKATSARNKLASAVEARPIPKTITVGPNHVLQIRESEFEISVAKLNKLPEPARTEVAFVGRSNVGKSSLINLLLGRKALAKVSGRPGKTRLLNYFLVNGEFHFVDLPGYGYAKTPEEMRQDWSRLIEGYLVSPRYKLIVQLIDARHGITKLDRESLEWMLHHMVPVVVVLTKTDKLSKLELADEQLRVRRSLKDMPVLQVISSSAKSRNGRDELLGFLGHWLSRKN